MIVLNIAASLCWEAKTISQRLAAANVETPHAGQD
jgi:hypothetical protein